ncbi:hypothetical protein pb186bvf_016107 [Paramecium bursaria]
MSNKRKTQEPLYKIQQFDDFQKRLKIKRKEDELNRDEAQMYEGIQLNKKSLHRKACILAFEQLKLPEDLDLYISRYSVVSKPENKTRPQFFYDLYT